MSTNYLAVEPGEHSSSRSNTYDTSFIDEGAYYLARGFTPSVLPPEQPSGWPRFRFAVSREFEEAREEWSSERTALIDVHLYISARKRLYGATDLYRRGAK